MAVVWSKPLVPQVKLDGDETWLVVVDGIARARCDTYDAALDIASAIRASVPASQQAGAEEKKR